MQKPLRDLEGLGRGYPIIGANSVEFTKYDPIYIDSSGFLDLISTSSKVFGYYVGQGETMTSDNETVALKTIDYVYAENIEMVFGSDQDATQTDVGAYADMGTATTGAFELNLAAGATGQFLVLGFDPYEESDDDAVVVVAAEVQKYAFAQA